MGLGEDISLCFLTFTLQKEDREMRVKMFIMQFSGDCRCLRYGFGNEKIV